MHGIPKTKARVLPIQLLKKMVNYSENSKANMDPTIGSISSTISSHARRTKSSRSLFTTRWRYPIVHSSRHRTVQTGPKEPASLTKTFVIFRTWSNTWTNVWAGSSTISTTLAWTKIRWSFFLVTMARTRRSPPKPSRVPSWVAKDERPMPEPTCHWWFVGLEKSRRE